MNSFLGLPFTEPSTWVLQRCAPSKGAACLDAEIHIPTLDMSVEVPRQHCRCCRTRLLLDSFVCHLHEEYTRNVANATDGESEAVESHALLEKQGRAQLIAYLAKLNVASVLDKKSDTITFKNQLPPAIRMVREPYAKGCIYTIKGRIELRSRRPCEHVEDRFPPLLAISPSDDCNALFKTTTSSCFLLLLEDVVCLEDDTPLWSATYSPFAFELKPCIVDATDQTPLHLSFDILASAFPADSPICKEWYEMEAEAKKHKNMTGPKYRFALYNSVPDEADEVLVEKRRKKWLRRRVRTLMAGPSEGSRKRGRPKQTQEREPPQSLTHKNTTLLTRVAVLASSHRIPVERCCPKISNDLSCVLPTTTTWPLVFRSGASVVRSLSSENKFADLLRALIE